jgi:ribonuclease D
MLRRLFQKAVGRVFRQPLKVSPNPPAHRNRANARPTAPTKAETSLLKPFHGLPLDKIFLPKTPAEYERAAEEIRAAGVAGFDTESKPVFRAGEKNHGPQLVQFALRDKAFLFQLHRHDCWDIVSELLESEDVMKVGFGLRNDRGQIHSKLGVQLRTIVDLDMIFRKQGYADQIGVRAAIGTLLKQNFPKSKSTTTSNWAAPVLMPRQLLYAANDAYAALRVMDALGLSREELLATSSEPKAKRSSSRRRADRPRRRRRRSRPRPAPDAA